MENTPPKIQEWRNLYDAAIAFRKTACWEWMWDSDIFGVQNPESGEIGYCCIMGQLGQHYALAVYLGTEGLEGHSKIQKDPAFFESMDALHLQKCLMASFEDRDYLRKEDISIMETLGLKFKGCAAYPCFRVYDPGFFPWFISAAQARFLAIALDQAIDVGLRFKQNQEILKSVRAGYHLVRVPVREGASLIWKDASLKPKPLVKKLMQIALVDEGRASKLLKKASRTRDVWEVDISYSPASVREKEQRPYFPRLFLCLEQSTGHILLAHAAGQDTYVSEFPDRLMSLMEGCGTIPAALFVRNKEVRELLGAVASRLGVELSVKPRLAGIEAAMLNLHQFLDSHPQQK